MSGAADPFEGEVFIFSYPVYTLAFEGTEAAVKKTCRGLAYPVITQESGAKIRALPLFTDEEGARDFIDRQESAAVVPVPFFVREELRAILEAVVRQDAARHVWFDPYGKWAKLWSVSDLLTTLRRA